MYLVSSQKETRDSLELIIRIYRRPVGEFLEVIAEKELQFRLNDLFTEITLVLIACVSACEAATDTQSLAACVTSGATVSIVDTSRIYVPHPPLT